MLKTQLNSTLKKLAKTNNRIVVGISGGKTIIKLLPFQLDSHVRKKCFFILIDERIVHWDSIKCNLRNLEASDPQINLFGPISKHQNMSALDYQLCIEKIVDTPLDKLELDLLILGFGLDGHVASIFNDNECDDLIYYSVNKEDSSKRMTFSMKLLLRSRQIYVISNSREKTKLLENLEVGLPIHKLIKHNNSDKLWIFEV